MYTTSEHQQLYMTVVVEIIWWKADFKQVNHNNEDFSIFISFLKAYFDVFDKNLK